MNKKSLIILGIEISAVIILYAFVNSKYLPMLPSCSIYQNTTWQCPACGGTRCVIFFLQGKWGQAFLAHSIFFMAILYAILVNIIYIINLNRKKPILTWIYPKPWYSIIFAILLILYWILRNLL